MTGTDFSKEIKGSLLWFICGCGYLAAAWQYDPGSAAAPGPGLYPLVIGFLLALLALGQVVRVGLAYLTRRASTGQAQRSSRFDCLTDPGEKRFFVALGFFVLYLLLLVPFGFFVTSFFFVIVMSRLSGADNWRQPLLLSVALSIVAWVVFVHWLKIRLPEGWWL